jgi:hypothetical protein
VMPQGHSLRAWRLLSIPLLISSMQAATAASRYRYFASLITSG